MSKKKKNRKKGTSSSRKRGRRTPGSTTIKEMLEKAFSVHQQGNLEQARKDYLKILEIAPDQPHTLHLLGVLALSDGRNSEAEGLIARAVEGFAEEPVFHNNLGTALLRQGKYSEAETSFQRALHLNPDYDGAHLNYGTAMMHQGRVDKAKYHFEKVLQLNPESAEGHYNLGTVFQGQAKLQEALSAYQRALQLNPGLTQAQSNFLFILNYHPQIDIQQVFRFHKAWGDNQAHLWCQPPAAHLRGAGEKDVVRIGYVSPDFRLHSVAFFLLPIIEGHDRRKFEVFCYSDVDQKDAVTDRFASAADRFTDISTLSDSDVFRIIEEDRIDILVDLAGHSAKNRMLLFAMKAAPLQISYCGYPNTSGLAQIDFRLTDPMADPPGMTDHLFTEKLARLPSSFLCYRSFEDGVEVSAPPFRKNGYITFGSFNTGLKVNDDVIEMWVKILHEVENSRLFLKAKHLGDPAIVDAWRAKFSNRGISADRVILRAQVSSSAEHLMLYHDIDIALDTFPYNGTTTTCEALWMGVPVITLCGRHHAARVGATILNALQLNDWITDSRDGYLRQAVSRAASHQDLEDLRGSLRQRMLSSPLMDEKGFLTDYETLLKRVWREGR